MARLVTITDDTLRYGGHVIEVLSPSRRAAAFGAYNKCSARLGLAVASGGFESPTAVKATARGAKLLCIDPETIHDARAKGLIV